MFNMYTISAAGFLTAPTALDSVDEYRGITFDTISEYQCSTIFIQPLQKTGRIRIQGSKIFFWCFITLYLILRPKKYFYHNQILVSGTKTIEIDSRLLESVPSTKTNSEFIQGNNPPDNKTNNNNNNDDDNYNDDYEKNTLITACDIIKRCRKSSGCVWCTQLLVYAAP